METFLLPFHLPCPLHRMLKVELGREWGMRSLQIDINVWTEWKLSLVLEFGP